MMKIYKLGPDSDPVFEQRIEWQDPKSGDVYYARTYGTTDRAASRPSTET